MAVQLDFEDKLWEMADKLRGVAALLICPNPALNYCRKLLMSFAV